MDFLPDIEKFKNFFDGSDSKNEISIAVEEAKKYDIFNLISKEFNDVVSKRLSYHYSKIIEYGVEKEDIFVIIIINSLGRGMAYGIKKYDYCYPPLRVHPFELMCISINEKAESVFIPRYLKAKNNLQTFETGILSELNQIEIYCNNNYSFYIKHILIAKAERIVSRIIEISKSKKIIKAAL